MEIPNLKHKLDFLYLHHPNLRSHADLERALGLRSEGANVRTWIYGNATRSANLIPNRHIRNLVDLLGISIKLLELDNLEQFKLQVEQIYIDDDHTLKAIAPNGYSKHNSNYQLCPYQGLSAFKPSNANLFFGREAFIEELVCHINNSHSTRLLALLGASGSGKSSIMLAGLLPALKSANHNHINQHVVVFRPGQNPLENLSLALLDSRQESDHLTQLQQMTTNLQQNKHSLDKIIKLKLAQESIDSLYIYIDQFEELFTLCDSLPQKHAFIDNILYASQAVDSNTYIILTLRADFYDQCTVLGEFAQELSKHHKLITPMTDNELRHAIIKPAQLVGLSFDESLVDLLIHEVKYQTGALPLLQDILTTLWEKRQSQKITLADYQALGEFKGALAHRADQILNSFDPEQKIICRFIFTRLTHLGYYSDDTKHSLAQPQLIPTHYDAQKALQVIKILVKERLLTVTQPLDQLKESMIEVSHEALIRHWPTLKDWLEQDKYCLHLSQRLSQAANDWQDHQCHNDYLYPQGRLQELLSFIERNELFLSESEHQFIAASQEYHKDKEKKAAKKQQQEIILLKQSDAKIRRLNRGLMVFTLLSALMAIATYWFYYNAETARLFAEVDAVYLKSRSVRASYPLKGLFLANLAFQQEQVNGRSQVDFEQNLVDQLNELPGIGLFVENSLPTTVALSFEEKFILAGGLDQRLRIWPFTPHRIIEDPIVDIMGNKGGINQLSLIKDSQNQQWLMSQGPSDIMVWDFNKLINATDQIPRQFKGQGNFLNIESQQQALLVTIDGPTIKIWHLNSQNPESQYTLNLPDAINAYTISADNNDLVVYSQEELTHINLADLTVQNTIPSSKANIKLLAMSPNKNMIIGSDSKNQLYIWQKIQNTFELIAIKSNHGSTIESLAFSANNDYLATGSGNGQVLLWKTREFQRDTVIPIELKGHDLAVRSLAFSHNNQWLASGSIDQKITVWPIQESDPNVYRQIWQGHESYVTHVSFTDDDRWLLSASFDNTIRLWDMRVKFPSTKVTASDHNGEILALAMNNNKHLLASGGRDDTIRLWSYPDFPKTVQAIQTIHSHQDDIWQLQLAANNNLLISTSDDGNIFAYFLDNNPVAPIHLGRHDAAIQEAAISPDDTVLATGSFDTTIKLWSLNSDTIQGQTPISLNNHNNTISQLAFNSDGSLLASADANGLIHLWSMDRGAATLVKTFEKHSSWVDGLSFSQDGQWLASSASDNSILLWPLIGQHTPRYIRLEGHQDIIWGFEFTRDNKYLISISKDKTVRIWPIPPSMDRLPERLSPGITLYGHQGEIMSLAIDSRANILATADTQGTIFLWDLNQTDPQLNAVTIKAHKGRILTLAFDSQAELLISGSEDTNIHFWDLKDYNKRRKQPIYCSRYEQYLHQTEQRLGYTLKNYFYQNMPKNSKIKQKIPPASCSIDENT